LSTNSASEPHEAELSAELGLTLEKYRRLLQAAQGIAVLHLDDRCSKIREIVATNEENAEHRILRYEVANAIQRLADCESRVMLALKRGESIREIARTLQLSDNQVHHIRLKAIQRLQTILGVTSRENP
jgi:DNA-directed RNA polymerase specialized sigma subunit